MSNKEIVFSPLAQQRFEELAEYLYEQQLSKRFVLDYLTKFEQWLENVLGLFPEAGRLMPEFGEGIRRVVYREYSFIYRIEDDAIEILTLYRENGPSGLSG